MSALKSVYSEKDRKERDYVSKSKALDDAYAGLVKAKTKKPKDVAKAEQKIDKADAALAPVTDAYHQQIKKSNEELFELFNERMPQLLQVRSHKP